MGLRIHEFRLLDDEHFRSVHCGFTAGGVDDLGSDDVDRKVDAFGFARLVVVADQFLGDDVIVGVSVGDEGGTAGALAAGGGFLGVFAEEESAQGAGGGGFADANRAGEDEAVREAVGRIGALEEIHRRVLRENVVERNHLV